MPGEEGYLEAGIAPGKVVSPDEVVQHLYYDGEFPQEM